MSRPITWEHGVNQFIEKLRGDNCTPATLTTYTVFLTGGRAKRFREAHGIESPRDLTLEIFEAMKGQFLADGLRPSTVDDYVRMWRTFAHYAFDRSWLDTAVHERVRRPRQPKLVPRTFTHEQELTLVGACKCARDRLLVRLTFATGLRRSEVANLTVDDVETSSAGWLLHVQQGKGRKDRAVPISRDLSEVIAQYLRKSRPTETQCRALFLTSSRRPHGDYGPLGSGAIYTIWRRLSELTGIVAYPHKARHTAATRWAQDGMSPWAIQQALGHSSLAMTQRYVDATAVDLRAAFAKRDNEVTAAPRRRHTRNDPIDDRDAVAAEVERVLAGLGVDVDDLRDLQRRRDRRLIDDSADLVDAFRSHRAPGAGAAVRRPTGGRR